MKQGGSDIILSNDTQIIPMFSNIYHRFCTPERLLRTIYTPLDKAVNEIKSRREDPVLIQKVREYLEDDIPAHFLQSMPIFYLSRFLATPNYETFHVRELVQSYNLPLVIGQDTKSKFVPSNELKWALGKLPVVRGLSHNQDEIIEYFTILNFPKNQGKQLCKIETNLNQSLVSFHKNLFSEANLAGVTIADETQWVERNHRDGIYKQYKKMMALQCIHGIMLESYPPSEYDFLREIVYPAFKEVEQKLGVKPLIVEHITQEQELERNWNSYPSVFYQYIKRQFPK